MTGVVVSRTSLLQSSPGEQLECVFVSFVALLTEKTPIPSLISS